jgi:chaperonin GroES
MPSTAIKVRPLGDRVLVRVVEEKEQRHGKIIIPDTAKEKPQEAEVVSTGPGRQLKSGGFVKPEVKKGDRVLFAKYSGSEVILGDEKYLIMREADLLAVL